LNDRKLDYGVWEEDRAHLILFWIGLIYYNHHQREVIEAERAEK